MWRELFLSSTFRALIGFVLIFTIAVTAATGFVYWGSLRYMEAQTNAVIDADIEGLADIYRQEGSRGLLAVIAERIRRDPGRSSIYLLSDASYRPIFGNLDQWPPNEVDDAGWLSFRLRDNGLDTGLPARGRPFRLPNGVNLFVGRDTSEVVALSEFLRRTLFGAALLSLLAGTLAGAFFSRRALSRLREIRRASREIAHGNLSERIARSTKSDDLDVMAENLNAMLDKVEALMRRLDQAGDNIAHDLKTPLARLRTRLTHLQAQSDERSGDGELAACIAELDGTLETFDALARLNRLAEKSIKRDARLVDLQVVVETALEFYEDEFAAKEFSIAISTESVSVNGEPELLCQALCNVFENAVKYLPAGAALTVAVSADGDNARLVVADNGRGLTAHERALATTRFFRASYSRSAEGSGLGLAIVDSIVNFHRGELTLDDNAPGLKITISLPRAAVLVSVA